MTGFDLGDPAPDDEPEENQSVDEEEDVNETPESEPESEPEPMSTSEPQQSVENQSSDDSEQEPDPTEAGPAFPYSEVKQSPLYAREETWTEFEDKLDVELTPKLREEGIRDDELREIHDIVLEVAIDNLDVFPERLKEKRREL